MIAALLLALAAVALMIQLASAMMVLARHLRRVRRSGGCGTPPVTLLRPVRGVDAHVEATLRSSFSLNYPDYEVVFCVQSIDDPAVPLVQRLIRENPKVTARLLIGDQPGLRNPKLRNLWKGWHAARHEWICMADANLRLPADYLKRVLESWGPRTGMVSSPPYGEAPEGFAGHLEGAFLNGNQARLQMAIDSLGHGFAQGKTMLFDRSILERAGGLAALDQLMAEDVNATLLMARLGLRVTLTRMPFPQPLGRRSFRQVLARQVRWAQVRREGFPLLYCLEPLNGALLPALASAGAIALTGLLPVWTVVYLAVWYGTEAVMARLVGWPMGWRDLVVSPVRDLMLPAIWMTAFLRDDFDWHGTTVSRSDGTTQSA